MRLLKGSYTVRVTDRYHVKHRSTRTRQSLWLDYVECKWLVKKYVSHKHTMQCVMQNENIFDFKLGINLP